MSENTLKTSKAFKGVAPYLVEDSYCFFGRKEKTDYLIQKILDDCKNIVIIGEPFVGKTSLINAGLVAGILKKTDALLIVQIEQYDNFTQKVDQIIEFFDKNNGYKKFLILDQLEEFLELLNENDLNTLAGKLDKAFNKNIQVILSCRNDEPRRKIASINNKCNSKFEFYGLSSAERLQGFSLDDCNQILNSLNKKTDDNFELDSFRNLAKDCFRIDEDTKEISPILLQLVCFKLQNIITLTPSEERSVDFYNKNNSFFLLKDYLISVLNGDLADIGADAARVLSFFSMTENQNYLSLEEINKFAEELKSTLPLINPEIEQTLSRLEKGKLIYRRKNNNIPRYFLTVPLYGKIAKNLEENEWGFELLTANQILHSKWYISDFATAKDLKLFNKFQDKLNLNPSKLFFLISSSVEESKPIVFWYEKLLTDDYGKKFLEDTFNSSNSNNFHKQLFIKLFQDRNNNEVSPINQSPGIEEFLKNKVVSSDILSVRQTAIITMTILQGEAFQINHIGKLSVWKKAEIVGTLLDYLPDQGRRFKFSITDYFFSWIWRILRRSQLRSFNISEIIIVLVSLIGGGIIYGMTRTQLSGSDLQNFVIEVIITSLLGFLSIAITLLAMFVAKFLQISPFDNNENHFLKRQSITDILIITVGALVFGIFNFSTNYSKNNYDWTYTIFLTILGIVAGAGIGLGLKIQGLFNSMPKVVRFFIGGLVSILLFSLVQLLYNSEQNFNKWQLFYSGSEIYTAAATGISFYLGILYGALKGKLFDESRD